PTFAYQWLDCDSGGNNCSPIQGATASSYTIQSTDVGFALEVVVTGSNSAGSSQAASAATSVVPQQPQAPLNILSPQISGTVAVGQQLQADPGSWTGTPAPTFAYQWQDCDSGGNNCSPIQGATASSYTIQASDGGFTLKVVVTGSNTAGSSQAASAPTTLVTKPPTSPVLDNFNRANGGAGSKWTLIKSTGFALMNVSSNTAVDSSTTNYAWNYWNPATFGPDVEAYATIATYSGDTIRIGARVTPGTSYSGYFVSVTATGAWSIIRVDNGGSPVTLASGVTQTLASGDKIGIRIVGSVITALHYTSSGWAQVLSYNTSQDAVRYPSPGSLAIEFRAGALDDFGGGTIAAPVNTRPPRGSAPVAVGRRLQASPGSWTGTPAPTFAYQWVDCDSGGNNCSPIQGATASSYTIQASDVGSALEVVVTGSNSAGSSQAASAPTTVVPQAPLNTQAPQISGTVAVGQQLQASPGSWTGTPAP